MATTAAPVTLKTLGRIDPVPTGFHEIEVIDQNPRRFAYNPNDPTEVLLAEAIFNTETGKGYAAFNPGVGKVKGFDPSVESTVITAPLVGG